MHVLHLCTIYEISRTFAWKHTVPSTAADQSRSKCTRPEQMCSVEFNILPGSKLQRYLALRDTSMTVNYSILLTLYARDRYCAPRAKILAMRTHQCVLNDVLRAGLRHAILYSSSECTRDQLGKCKYF